jgi:hypothetical protein
MGTINHLSASYLQSILGSSLQDIGSIAKSAGTSLSSGVASLTQQPDSPQLSQFAQLLNTLQQLQQSDPAKYQQVTQQIATNLQSAAQTAQDDGNSTAASTLTQLSKDFSAASSSGQLPNVQDLAKAIGGGHHHHHHFHAAPPDGASSGDDSPANNSTSQALSKFLSGSQLAKTPNSLNPLAIILNTLSTAGIASTNG